MPLLRIPASNKPLKWKSSTDLLSISPNCHISCKTLPPSRDSRGKNTDQSLDIAHVVVYRRRNSDLILLQSYVNLRVRYGLVKFGPHPLLREYDAGPLTIGWSQLVESMLRQFFLQAPQHGFPLAGDFGHTDLVDVFQRSRHGCKTGPVRRAHLKQMRRVRSQFVLAGSRARRIKWKKMTF